MASDLPDRFLSEYERFGRADDPLMDHLVRRRTAVTERDSGPEPTVCARWGMGRILIVPLFGEHGVAGSLNFVRPEGAPGFTAQTSSRRSPSPARRPSPSRGASASRSPRA